MPLTASEAKRTEQELRCPGCGYDQRGVVAQTTGNATATCSECGARFRWEEVVARSIRAPSWCVEFAKGRFSFLRGTVTTLLMSLRPWRFWTDLTPASRPRLFRAFLYALFLAVIVLYPAFVCSHTLMMLDRVNDNIRNDALVVSAPPTSAFLWQAAVTPFATRPAGDVTYQYASGEIVTRPFFPPSDFLHDHIPGRHVLSMVLVPVLLWFVLPMLFRMVVREDRATSQIIRIAVYSSPVLLIVVVWMDLREATMRLHTAPGAALLHDGLGPLCHVVVPTLLLFWWVAAARQSLNVPFAIWKAIVVFAIGFACAIVLAGILASLVST